MKNFIKIALSTALCASFTQAKISSLEATPENIAKFSQIVDVRSSAEWAETGVIKGAKLVTLKSDIAKFKAELKNAGVDLSKPVAFICRSGNRSMIAAQMIDDKNADITNLKGGMSNLISKGYKTTPYSK